MLTYNMLPLKIALIDLAPSCYRSRRVESRLLVTHREYYLKIKCSVGRKLGALMTSCSIQDLICAHKSGLPGLSPPVPHDPQALLLDLQLIGASLAYLFTNHYLLCKGRCWGKGRLQGKYLEQCLVKSNFVLDKVPLHM